MAPHFGRVYEQAIYTKMFPLMHGTQKYLFWSCKPPVQFSTELRNIKKQPKSMQCGIQWKFNGNMKSSNLAVHG